MRSETLSCHIEECALGEKVSLNLLSEKWLLVLSAAEHTLCAAWWYHWKCGCEVWMKCHIGTSHHGHSCKSKKSSVKVKTREKNKSQEASMMVKIQPGYGESEWLVHSRLLCSLLILTLLWSHLVCFFSLSSCWNPCDRSGHSSKCV